MDTILEMKQITKEFPGVKALDDVTFKVNRGQIHALCGENGAGKSTLMKVLSGVFLYGDYNGDIVINGNVQKFQSIKDSENAGVTIIYQELALVKDMTIAENIFLGNEKAKKGIISWEDMNESANEWLKKVGLSVEAIEKVGSLGVGQQQLVEIAKALSKDCEIIIMDEPTAALAEEEVEILMEILNQLREQGITVIYISHKLKEVMQIADEVTVLRDGQTIDTKAISEVTENDIISLMVGRELKNLFPYQDNRKKETIMKVEDFAFKLKGSGTPVTSHINFDLKKGEVLGIGGLMGAGRTELAMSLFGGYEGKAEGTVEIDGKRYGIAGPKEAIDYGLAYVSEDRKRYGLVLGMDVAQNTTLASLGKISSLSFLQKEQEVVQTEHFNEKMRVKTPSLETPVLTLSGGNQQKVVLSKWLMTNPKVLILDEPTRGIDVGAKQEIYKLINELTEQGVSVIMISSELPELLGMSDRVLVMADYSITGELTREEANQEAILKLATGGETHEK
ncbi:xylose ABC transporter ATP-binding protein [Pelagirhabdus alkalitolerans]|uniref:Xylose ABC transporter ATP-binding protein n=1 Tax=Pelagirhabdus alkalitolerans TaxID=1612202 RepID=A0A1G6LFL2_9BACI|nr:ATP-binding cassette domain-containing protein [Pelagirhabdus alkalitolerans]SDC41555.1 xylose ABC transporter ATP-binding protein [Pelagirhabdus alkalitolerans]